MTNARQNLVTRNHQEKTESDGTFYNRIEELRLSHPRTASDADARCKHTSSHIQLSGSDLFLSSSIMAACWPKPCQASATKMKSDSIKMTGIPWISFHSSYHLERSLKYLLCAVLPLYLNDDSSTLRFEVKRRIYASAGARKRVYRSSWLKYWEAITIHTPQKYIMAILCQEAVQYKSTSPVFKTKAQNELLIQNHVWLTTHVTLLIGHHRQIADFESWDALRLFAGRFGSSSPTFVSLQCTWCSSLAGWCSVTAKRWPSWF